jgi:hypothetical protein
VTEWEWVTCKDPEPMLEHLRSKAGERNVRLFACACCRRIWKLLSEGCRNAVVTAERFAENEAALEELVAAYHTVNALRPPLGNHSPHVSPGWEYWAAEATTLTASSPEAFPSNASVSYDQTVYNYLDILSSAANSVAMAAALGDVAMNVQAAKFVQSRLVHDIFGNPFRPATREGAWVTPTVTGLASAAYEERVLPTGELDPARLAVLADAIEEAGCPNADILNHLRERGPHVRGCWPVDLLLGKE